MIVFLLFVCWNCSGISVDSLVLLWVFFFNWYLFFVVKGVKYRVMVLVIIMISIDKNNIICVMYYLFMLYVCIMVILLFI